MFVAEAGTGYDAVDQTQNTGKLTHFRDLNGDGDFDDDGEADRWFSTLPTYNALSFFGSGRDEVSGPGDVLLHEDGRIFLTVDGGLDEQDLFEISPERRVGRSLASRSNMNGIAFDLHQSSIYAVESMANRLVEIPLDGEIRDIVTFADLAHGQQSVPAGLAVDPLTGEILVALFSGNAVDPETGDVTPFVIGDSKVVRVDPSTGRVTDEITGLTVAVDVAVDESANIYVVELASVPAETLPTLFDLFDPEGPVLHGGYLRFSGRITFHPAEGGRRRLAGRDRRRSRPDIPPTSRSAPTARSTSRPGRARRAGRSRGLTRGWRANANRRTGDPHLQLLGRAAGPGGRSPDDIDPAPRTGIYS